MDYSFGEMLEFLEYAGEHGLINKSTAVAYKTAASKVESDLTEQEARDVREVDLPVLFQRFVNKNRVKIAPDTLRTYQRRLETAIQEFTTWRQDPTAYRPRGRGRTAASKKDPQPNKTPGTSRRAESPTESEIGASGIVSDSHPAKMILTVPYPLRPDFLASVQIPRDLKAVEADRLAAFIRTLAVDFKPQ